MTLPRLLRVLAVCGLSLVLAGLARAQSAVSPEGETSTTVTTATATGPDAAQQAAAAAIASGQATVPHSDFLEHLVDVMLETFNVRTSGNTPTHYGIAALLLVGSFLLRRVVTIWIFSFFRRLAARTTTTLDDKLFPALEGPVKAFITLLGAVAALKVLKLSPEADRVFGYASTIAFSLTTLWFFLRILNSVLDHLHELARERHMGVAAFMPWIKKSVITILVVFGALMVAQSLGADVKAALAGLGLGGLAFALAAQDTLANLFGSVVVAIDQPFKLGDYVKIGGAGEGTVEDIGLRSTRLRNVNRSLIIVPNKTVAAEPITNLSKFNARRVEQFIGITYEATPEQMEAIVDGIRAIISSDEGVDPTSVWSQFVNFGASSLDIQVVYVTKKPDWVPQLQIRQRINLAIMRLVAQHGASFAFPTQTINFDSSLGRALAESRTLKPVEPPPAGPAS